MRILKSTDNEINKTKRVIQLEMFTKPNKHLISATVKRDIITFAVYGNFTAGVS